MANVTQTIIDPRFTNEISSQFDKFMKDLQQERYKAEETINTWAEALHFQIHEHVKDQKIFLQSYFSERQRILCNKRYEIELEMRRYNRDHEYGKIHNLLKLCKTLKFELLVKFTYEDKPISFIQCVTEEHLTQQNKNESNATNTGNFISEAKLDLKNIKNPENNTDLLRNPTFTNEQHTARPSATSNPTNQHDPSISGNDGSGRKCPICSMIFPSYMKSDDQQKHVNEHLT